MKSQTCMSDWQPKRMMGLLPVARGQHYLNLSEKCNVAVDSLYKKLPSNKVTEKQRLIVIFFLIPSNLTCRANG